MGFDNSGVKGLRNLNHHVVQEYLIMHYTSGIHLGHYRFLFVDDEYSGYTEEERDPSKNIVAVYYNVGTVAHQWGISLEQ
jgi:hypothetical protein